MIGRRHVQQITNLENRSFDPLRIDGEIAVTFSTDKIRRTGPLKQGHAGIQCSRPRQSELVHVFVRHLGQCTKPTT